MKDKRKERVTRFGVSLEKPLLERLDQFGKQRGFPNRSQALRALLREYMVEQERLGEGDIAGTVTIVYDHHQKTVVRKLVATQHDFHDIIIASQHIHIDHDNCLEVVIIKGPSTKARELCDRLRAIKSVKHIALNTTTTGTEVS